jgi:hypothetical protein
MASVGVAIYLSESRQGFTGLPSIPNRPEMALSSGTEWQRRSASPTAQPESEPQPPVALVAFESIADVKSLDVNSSGQPQSSLTDTPTRRSVTGHAWQSDTTAEGHGILEVINGNTKDGVAVVYQNVAGAESAIRAVYIRAGERTSLPGIAPARYGLRFMLGIDWDEDAREFKGGLECYAFADSFNFVERRTNDTIHYDKQSVTLHNMIKGSIQPKAVNRAALRFDALSRFR